MKRISILLCVFVFVLSVYSQNNLQDDNRCFDSGDYACAIIYYDSLFKQSTGKDRQIAEIKLTRANWCADHIKTANREFDAQNYSTAKDEYKKVLDSNPKDSYAQSQIEKCDIALNPPKLRKATTSELTDIWDNKYGINPQRRQNLINAGIDPEDAQRRINRGEGKPQDKQSTSLSVSKGMLYFASNGKTSQIVKVESNLEPYSIPLGYIPSWCTVKTGNGYFTVTVAANPTNASRKGSFKVTSGGKEVKIYVEQSANNQYSSQQSAGWKKSKTNNNEGPCFNCPKTHDTWGLTLGYINQNPIEVIQLGLKVEPLFKYGFGLNTGINILCYSDNLFDLQLFENGFDAYAVNIPLHIEYRLNFSKWFNIFAYGGVGFNAIVNPSFDSYAFPTTFDYGGGFRISHVQFNVGSSLYLGDFRKSPIFGNSIGTNKNLNFSVSYMF